MERQVKKPALNVLTAMLPVLPLLAFVLAAVAVFVTPAHAQPFETPAEHAQRLQDEQTRADAAHVCRRDEACVEGQLAARERMFKIFNATGDARSWFYSPGQGVLPTGGPEMGRAHIAREAWISAAGQATDRRHRVNWTEAETSFGEMIASRGITADVQCIDQSQVNKFLCFKEVGQ